MGEKFSNLFNDFNFNNPASENNVKNVEKLLNINFPKEYYDFLLTSNGGEGTIGHSYLILWEVENLVELNEAYGVKEFAPGLLIIGSDGGDTAYCIDIRNNDRKPFVMIPFIGMDLSEINICGNDFIEFLSALKKL